MDPRRRTWRNLAGAALAALIALAILSPHIVWLVRHDFAPMRYAAAVVELHNGNRLSGALAFVGGVVARLAPLIVVAAFALRRAPGMAPPAGRAPMRDRSFLWMVGALPLALTLVIGLAGGSNPPVRWATGGLLLSGWLVLDAWPRPVNLRRILLAAGVMQVLLCTADTIVGPRISAALHAPGRTNFPAIALAAAAQSTWLENESRPMRLVVSDTWLGGNIVARWHGTPPAVLVDGLPARAPWVPPDAVRRCGALVLLDSSPDASSDADVRAALESYLDQAGVHGDWELPWPGLRKPPDDPKRAWVHWGIIPPQPGATCPL